MGSQKRIFWSVMPIHRFSTVDGRRVYTSLVFSLSLVLLLNCSYTKTDEEVLTLPQTSTYKHPADDPMPRSGVVSFLNLEFGSAIREEAPGDILWFLFCTLNYI